MSWRYFGFGAAGAAAILGCLFFEAFAFSSGPTFSNPSSSSAVNAAGKSLLTVQAPNLFADAGAVIINGHNCAYELTSDVSGNLAVSTTVGGSCGGGIEIFTVNNEAIATGLNVGTAFTQGALNVTGPSAGAGGTLKATGLIQGLNLYADGGSLEVAGPNCTYTLTSDVSGHLQIGSVPTNCGGPGNYMEVAYLNVTPGGLFVDTIYSNGGEALTMYYGATTTSANGWSVGSNIAPVVTSSTVQEAIEHGHSAVTSSPVTFGTAFTAAPDCACTDTTGTATLVGCSASTTQLTIHGTGSDVIAWVCVGTK